MLPSQLQDSFLLIHLANDICDHLQNSSRFEHRGQRLERQVIMVPCDVVGISPTRWSRCPG